MTYVKTDWETGDIITAEKLNHMESGIENACESAEVYYIAADENFENYLFLNSDFTPAQPAHIGAEYFFKAESITDDYDESISVFSELVKTEFYLLMGMSSAVPPQKLIYNAEISSNNAVISTLYGFDSIAQSGELQYFRLVFNSSGDIVTISHE